MARASRPSRTRRGADRGDRQGIRGSAQCGGRTSIPPRTSIVLQRRGYVFHAGLTPEIAAIAGLRDAAPAAGVSRSGFVSLEALVAARPDYLIVSDADQRAEDEGEALLVHPALAALYPPDRRLVAPDRLTICDGPSTPALIATLGREIRAKVR